MKKIFVILGLLVFFSLAGFSCNNTGTTNSSSTSEPYYSSSAKVMEFYSDYCGWCIKEKDILSELAVLGYKVKPMNVGEHQNYWKDYGITGTPSFLAPDGTKLEGYQDKDALKAFLDKYK